MKFLDKLDKMFIYLGMVALFTIMVIVAIDGLLRQFFDAPIEGAYLLVEKYLMVAMIFPAIGYTWAKKGHISINVIYTKLPRMIQNIAYLLILLSAIFVAYLMGYTGFEKTMTAFTDHHTTSGLVRWPLWLAYVWVPIGAALFMLRIGVEFVISIKDILKHGLSKAQIHKVEQNLDEIH